MNRAPLRISAVASSTLALTGFVNLCGSPTPVTAPPQPEIDRAVIDGYQSFARRDCGAVGETARSADFVRVSGAKRAFLDLLRAYCVELGGDVAAARKLYSAIPTDSPPGADAASRIRELERLERSGITHTQLKQTLDRERIAWSLAKPGDVRPIRRVDPIYPVAAREAGVEGFATVDFGIRSDGSIEDAVVFESDPPFVFDAAALDAVRTWQYEPPKTEQPVRSLVRLQFEIEQSPPPARP